jgi:hypothetical protein
MAYFPEYSLSMKNLPTIETGVTTTDDIVYGAKKRTLADKIREQSGELLEYVRNSDFWIDDIRITTRDGQVSIKEGLTQKEAAELDRPEFFTWWRDMPDYIKFGIPAIALFLLLRGRR